MKKKHNHNIALFSAGLILIILGATYFLAQIEGSLVSLIFINTGLALTVIGVLKFNHLGGGVKQDERTRQLSSVALAYSWLTTLIMLNLIFWLDWLDLINLDLSQGIALTLAVMIISANLSKWRLNRKGFFYEK